MTKENYTQTGDKRQDAEVPQPPPFERKLQIAPLQRIGISLLSLLPLLALGGLFGVSPADAQAANEQVSLRVEYLARTRYSVQGQMTVAVENRSVENRSADSQPGTQGVTVTVRIARAYIDSFANVSFAPAVDAIEDDAYVVQLANLPSGAKRAITVDLAGDQYGWHRGTVSAAIDSGTPVSVAVHSLIFP